ncbi:type I restriction endonuclease subunit R [Tenacibaculum finnmarkense]|uniref:type I restriction endonuclease subunit R n=1 Tax=Tenacibaculum finnmarkense TaxID=2781243 RepID=UPI001EFAB30A|nr:HsdR family type I site-specific deoxyribonuclease [Tenacibaculum finnmarkense]MCG8900752.1 type I restriction endonuclease subunit R [Tenacibaculum finnmarkense]
MSTPSYIEDNVSQIPALQLLINMGYQYVSPKQAEQWRGGKSQVLFAEVLRKQLKEINVINRKGKEYAFSDANINSAVLAVKDLPIQDGFINANKAFYDLITLGKAFEQSIDGDKKSHTINFIDWVNPANNIFHVTEEFSVFRTGRTDTYRPDLVLFINGIPTVIIECKSPSLTGVKAPVSLGIEQHIRNFSKEGIRSLYVYSNILMSIATNDGSYATTGTSKEFWAKWKEQFTSSETEKAYWLKLKALKNKSLEEAQKNLLFEERTLYVRKSFDGFDTEERLFTEQDKLIYNLCRPARLLDLILNFTLYDDGIKKVARYQQYFGVNNTINRVTKLDATGKRKGGVIWHTQGSGKSLTMVMLAQMLASNATILNPKIILVTDRIDLDDQISDTFKKCKKEVRQAKTGKHLSELLEDSDDAIITTIINKFEATVKNNKKPFTSADIFVLIDEGHRTQYGTFNVSMQRVFPNACFLAFTGTPLMKKERSTATKFGGYIGKPYTVKDAVEDGAVVPLLYEGRHTQILLNEAPLNTYFEKLAERNNLTKRGRAKLKQKFNTVNELNRADQVIYARALDISEHYTTFFQTHNDNYKPKAQLVAPTIKTALLYKEYLDEIGMVDSAVVVTQSDQREGTEDGYFNENEDKRREDKYLNAMIDKYGDLKTYEKSIINQFKNRDKPEILIVVAKLLTGFDAPNNTVLYLCRSLKEHTLLQAIARVNRVYPGKEYGYVVDYYGNLENLDTALSTYSNLNDFDEEDLEGAITNIKDEIDRLPQAHSELWDIFKTLKGKNLEPTAYEEHVSPEDVRNTFYTKVSQFARLLKLALSSVDFVTKTASNKIDMYKHDAKFFLKLRVDVTRRYNDDIAYKEFEPQIQKLINKHITTDGEVMKITELVDIFNKEDRDAEVEKIKGKAAQADHIASRTVKAINIKMQEDPIYYRKLADLIKETIAAYHQKRIDEAEYLKRAKEQEYEVFNGHSKDVPDELVNNTVAIAFYNFSTSIFDDIVLLKTPFHIEVSLTIDKTVKQYIYLNQKKIIDWHKNEDITGKINIELGDVIYDLHQKFDIDADWDKIDNLIEECLKIAIFKYK